MTVTPENSYLEVSVQLQMLTELRREKYFLSKTVELAIQRRAGDQQDGAGKDRPSCPASRASGRG